MVCGIITFHRAINYGGVLQSYALATAINNYFGRAEIIDYYCPAIENLYRGAIHPDFFSIKHFVYSIVYNGTMSFNNKGFDRFRKQFLPLSQKSYKSIDELKEANKYYDRFITGSDQIWSPTCVGFDPAYFLCFVDDDTKKYSYAASFGTSQIDESMRNEYTKRLSSFQKISVREESGASLVASLTGKNAKVHIDPTFLLTADEWRAVYTSCKKRVQYKYVLVYSIGEDPELLKCAKAEAARLSAKTVYITDRVYNKFGVVNLRKTDPDEWLWLIDHAQAVFTNSYHGMVFSTIFGKSLYAMYLKNNKNANTRIETLMNTFHLKHCLIGDLIEKHTEIKTDVSILNQLKANALLYLEEIMENE